MKTYVICDNLDTLTGLRLVGIEGEIVGSNQEFMGAFNKVLADKSIGILFISPSLIDSNQDAVNEVRFNRSTPLITTVQGAHEYQNATNTIAETIQHAIGIQL
jgi:V/A-type H+-transporting ATPase subunit F